MNLKKVEILSSVFLFSRQAIAKGISSSKPFQMQASFARTSSRASSF